MLSGLLALPPAGTMRRSLRTAATLTVWPTCAAVMPPRVRRATAPLARGVRTRVSVPGGGLNGWPASSASHVR